MRKLVCAALSLFVLLSSGVVFAKDDQKVTICHKGKSITVPASAVRAHLQHGDTEGECAVSYEKLYRYRYDPSVAVYYHEERNLYFYQVNGVWQAGATLPDGIVLNAADMVEIGLATDTPYTQHAQVSQQYPAPLSPTPSVTYKYLYYANSGVYYNVTLQQYFYQVNGVWQAGAMLPESIQLSEDDAVEIELDTDAPYLQHHIIKQEYSGEVEAEVSEGESEGGQRDDQKVRICHKGKVISVPQAAVAAHVKHGDTVGACPPAQKKQTPAKAQKKDKHEQKKDKKAKNK